MRFDPVRDQAEGLRQILLRKEVRLLAVAGAQPGLGATSLVISLAAALAEANKQVLIMDEHLGHDNVANMLSLRPRHDLLHAVRDGLSWQGVLLHAAAGVQVLPVCRAMQALSGLSRAEKESLLHCSVAASRGADVVLLDASVESGSLCEMAQDLPMLLVADATPEGITTTYALLKRLSLQQRRKKFDLIFNRTRDGADVRQVFDNMAHLAQHRMGVALHLVGCIPLHGSAGAAGATSREAVGSLARHLQQRAVVGNELESMMQNLLRMPGLAPRRTMAREQAYATG